MKDAQKPDHISLNTLLNRLKEGRFVIPDSQREFEWRPWDISELMRSIFLDYYIGSLLLAAGFLAIGSCMSALTRNQVVAFILGVVACFVVLCCFAVMSGRMLVVLCCFSMMLCRFFRHNSS